MNEYIAPLIELLNEMSPYLLLGFLIAGILHEFVPQSIYSKQLSKGNFRSVMIAALFGVPLPLCSCGVIPTAMSLRRAGASKGATASFLISTPQTGVDSIIATASLLGVPFAILRPIAAFVTAIAGGCLVNSFDKETSGAEEVQRAEEKRDKNFYRKCIDALKYGFVDMIQDIGKWIVIGLIIAGLITVFLPDNFFTLYSDRPIINMLLVVAVAAPMYLCATGSIPIAAALMLKGLSPGAALVLLMAGPATNMAAILVINKVMGSRTLFIYLLSIIAGAFGFGIITDYLLPAEWFTGAIVSHSSDCCASHITEWWKIASSILFTLLLIFAFIYKPHNHKNNTDMQSKFRIKGMMCNHCKNNVEKNLAKVEGVTAVTVDLTEGVALVEGNFDPAKVVATINELGYEYVE